MGDRLPPAKKSEWSEETTSVLGQATPAAESPDGQGPPNILYTIAHHPALLPAFLGFTSTLALRGVLTRRDSEILALRASWNCQSAFEWGHHVEYAEAEGVTSEEILDIAYGPDAVSWSESDRLLLTVADELHNDQRLSDPTFAALATRYSPAQIVEATFIVGNYTMLSMVANATGVPLENRLPELPVPGSDSRAKRPAG